MSFSEVGHSYLERTKFRSRLFQVLGPDDALQLILCWAVGDVAATLLNVGRTCRLKLLSKTTQFGPPTAHFDVGR
jgi:hypothetical protein